MTTAVRNRKIKTILEQAFGRGNVTVRGSRGTAYGWVHVNIAYAPRDRNEATKLRTMIWQLFDKASIEIDTYGYDDPGSDYGFGKKVNLDFLPCLKSEWVA